MHEGQLNFDGLCPECEGSGRTFNRAGTEIPCPSCSTPVRDVPHARSTDPSTSHRAAANVEAREGGTGSMRPHTKKHESLSIIGALAQSARDVGRRCGDIEIHKRVSDLKNAGLITAVGEVYDRETKQDVTVWGITELGRRVLARLDAGETVRL